MNSTGEPGRAVRRIAGTIGITVGIIGVALALALAGGVVAAFVMGLIWIGERL